MQNNNHVNCSIPQKYGAPEKHFASPAHTPTANTLTKTSPSSTVGTGRVSNL